MSDFPALGSQPALPNASTPSSTTMFSSYASHVGSGASNSPMIMQQNAAPFTKDEFPALRASAAQDTASASSASPAALMASGAPFAHDQSPAWQHEHQRRGMVPQDFARSAGLPSPPARAAAGASAAGWAPSYTGSPSPAAMTLNHARASGGAAGAPSFLPTEPAVEKLELGKLPSGSQELGQLPIHQVLSSPVDCFGLVGLVGLIKTQDPDTALLTMGTNLQSLGLNIESTEPLHSSLVLPWAKDAAAAAMQVEPAYELPSCYNVQPPPPAHTKMTSFSDETLFFIFYSTPRDVLQEVAAQELYARNWRYHKGLHLWLTKEPNTEPVQKTPTYERGAYVFFDPGSWEKVSKSFVLMYEMLEEKPGSQNLMAATLPPSGPLAKGVPLAPTRGTPLPTGGAAASFT